MQIVGLSFLSTLQSAFTSIFDSVLKPVISDVLSIVITTVGYLIQDLLSDLLYMSWVVLLKLIGFLEDIFDIFAGLSEVKVSDVSTGMSLLDYLMQQQAMYEIVMGVTLISFVLVFLTTLIGVLRSITDMTLENKNPLSQVMRDAFKAAFSVLMVPVICLFTLSMMNNLMVAVHTELDMGATDGADISDLIFITVAQSVANDGDVILEYSSGHGYEDRDAVSEDFDLGELNWLLAVTASAFIAFILLVTILQCILRIFMLLILYVAGPLVAVTMPLDGGSKYRDWKKMFIAHAISAFGPLLTMKFYFMILGLVFSSGTSIQFNQSSEVTTIIEVMLMLGGSYAVFSARNLFVTVVDPNTASMMAASGGFLTAGLGRLQQKMTSGGGGGKQVVSQTKQAPIQTKSQAYSGK